MTREHDEDALIELSGKLIRVCKPFDANTIILAAAFMVARVTTQEPPEIRHRAVGVLVEAVLEALHEGDLKGGAS